MTNFKRTKNLLAQAKVIQHEAQNEFEQGFWNLCIRRCQETVELALKGLLVSMGVEYPKTHDVGHVLVRALKKKRIEVPSREISEVVKISRACLSGALRLSTEKKSLTEFKPKGPFRILEKYSPLCGIFSRKSCDLIISGRMTRVLACSEI